MELAPTQRDITRIRRERSALAVSLALEGRWEEAAAVNLELLKLSSEDVEALNRLGKAYLEMGRYPQARGAFHQALVLSPHNTIAQKNLQRLSHLEDRAAAPSASARKVTPDLFIEESCKSTVTVLRNPASQRVLAKMAAGDPVTLQCQDSKLRVVNLQGEYLGQVEPKLAARVIRLTRGGNKYAGAVVSIRQQEVVITLREVYTHPSLQGVCSFPARLSQEQLAYLHSPHLRLELESEAEGTDQAVSAWGDEEEGGEEETLTSGSGLAFPVEDQDEEEEE